MAGVTVEELARQVGGIPLETMYAQLAQAGVVVSKPDDMLTEEQRLALLQFLKNERGTESALEKPKKISLKRRKVSEIKVTRSSGRKSTVSVVNKQRRVYVKKDPQEEAAAEAEKELEAEENKLNDIATDSESTVAEEASQVTDTPKQAEEEPEVVAEDKPKAPDVKTEEIEQPAIVDASEEKLEKVTKATPVAVDEVAETPKEKEASSDKRSGKKHPKKTGTAKEKEKEAAHHAEHSSRGDRRKGKKEVEAALSGDGEDGLLRGRRRHKGKRKTHEKVTSTIQQHAFEKPTAPVVKEVVVLETITVAELAQKMSVKAADLIKALMKMGVMATINQVIDQDTACLAIEEMGHVAKPMKDNSIEDALDFEYQTEVVQRAPIVTVMGHVDHGKTSLLDYIRRTKVTAKEAGGITQHIGAYHVDTDKGSITFLDTPGHAAFTAMRARGAKCTDIVILIVAADDGVMPQTLEAIQHAKAAEVPVIVAINKIDKPDADLDRVQNELAQHDLIPESWGGDVMFIPLSAKEGTGVDNLLDAILLQSEMLELSAANEGPAKGIVLEARLDKGRGSVSSVLVQTGCLHQGDMVLAGLEFGRIRALMDENGKLTDKAGPSTPVEILGLSGTPSAGDEFTVVRDEKKAREIALYRQGKHRDIKLSRQQSSKLDGFFDRMQQSDVKALNIILKADVQGSVEAITEALEKLSNEQIAVKIVSAGVGGLNESDINLAMASEGVVIGFNVRADASARRLAQSECIDINYYSIIYDVIDGIKQAINGRLGPRYVDKIVGIARVQDVFRSAKLGSVAGSIVEEGTVKRGKPIRVLRDNVVIYEGELESLRRFKDDVSEVKNGLECGIAVKNYNDVKAGDQIEVYETVEVERQV